MSDPAMLQSPPAGLVQEVVPALLKVRLPFFHRLDCFVKIWVLKALARLAYEVHKILYPPPPSISPTLIKRYPCRPGLETRIFFPSGREKPEESLPVFLCIHGGGFAVGNPHHDDSICSMLARRTGMLVVSLDYSKAPLHPFPAGVLDVEALADAVLADPSLPIDKARVAIGGFSAGGNLALGASQLPALKGRIKAALIFFPIVDWSHAQDVKLARRPYSNDESPVPDSLKSAGYWFDWAYVSVGQNRCDPVLSPCYAKREDLPPWIYMVGAQWDMLRLEAQEMIHALAGLEERETKEADFEEGTYKWTLAWGCSHGFTHHFWKKAEEKKRRQELCEPIYQDASDWLQKALRD
ncbi:alpha/beta hydrolase fold protein [Apiospora rasikravindrae]|uniref:Alpha/beta hydrolase fold protein n=1 Tax=Apiospora rasikravindrae TaxID=990691 RepID=A0ABR1SPF4_9PEZI